MVRRHCARVMGHLPPHREWVHQGSFQPRLSIDPGQSQRRYDQACAVLQPTFACLLGRRYLDIDRAGGRNPRALARPSAGDRLLSRRLGSPLWRPAGHVRRIAPQDIEENYPRRGVGTVAMKTRRCQRIGRVSERRRPHVKACCRRSARHARKSPSSGYRRLPPRR